MAPKYQRRIAGLDEKIISLYARGLSVRDISEQLEELYGAKISSALISEVTNSVAEDVKVWQSRPLDELYPIVYLDAIYVNCLLYTSPSPRDLSTSRMPSSA